MPRQTPIQPRKQPRQARAELTRRRILDAAAHVFAEYGYAAGTTNRIAEQAGISIGSLYQYYPNKDALLLELLSQHLDASPMLALTENGSAQRDLEDMLRATVRASIDNHRHDPHLLQVMIEQAPRSGELIARMETVQRETAQRLETVLREHPEVRVADVATAAQLVLTTVELSVHLLVAAPDPVDASHLETEMVAMLSGYLRGS
ncbi:TetR/AcrR family transcriptional regulator [Kineosporia mesophila]|uniref:TetR/AcrR family transcriptional regulator n=1 Tax=Kineosporia mesophila TaxID=566012 RepID=A0ABP7ANF8_9ACTN|nr:TetR/AcrR family transcriptional regulator [Kineosporia mesophila]MCD5349379.1 TetR/AcrR family transcriptional regulator [Kineosporia mesophila]